jgi:hypothetical protein
LGSVGLDVRGKLDRVATRIGVITGAGGGCPDAVQQRDLRNLDAFALLAVRFERVS